MTQSSAQPHIRSSHGCHLNHPQVRLKSKLKLRHVIYFILVILPFGKTVLARDYDHKSKSMCSSTELDCIPKEKGSFSSLMALLCDS